MLNRYYDLRKRGYDHFDALERLQVSFDERIEIENHLYNRETVKYAKGNWVILIVAFAVCVLGYYVGRYFLL